MTRQTLPNRRAAESFTFNHKHRDHRISVGRFDDGRPAEIFLAEGKSGTDMAAITRDTAILVSLALQSGVPLQTMRHGVTRDENGVAASIIGAALDAVE